MFSLSSQVKGGRKLSAQRGGGSIAQWLAFLLPDLAVLGLYPGSVEIFSRYCLVCGQYRDRTYPVLEQGISQMQLAAKACSAKNCKKVKHFYPQERV